MIIREATAEDAGKIIELTNLVFEEETDLAEAERIFRETENDKNSVHIVAEEEGRIVGLIRLAFIPTMFDGMDTYAILNHVCVHPEMRRGGIATAMLRECERLCQERGCKHMKLWSKNTRTAAHACYRKFGFIGIDATFFEKEVE